MSQATTTLLRFFAVGFDGSPSSSAFALEPAAAAGFDTEAALGRFLDDVAEGVGEDAESAVANCGDEAWAAEVEPLKLWVGVGTGELSKEMLERPLRIETSSKAA